MALLIDEQLVDMAPAPPQRRRRIVVGGKTKHETKSFFFFFVVCRLVFVSSIRFFFLFDQRKNVT
jgi:hypothetical protein